MLLEWLWCAMVGLYSAREGRWAGSGLSELAPSWPVQYLGAYQYLGMPNASWATIITERVCWQSGMSSLGISGYP